MKNKNIECRIKTKDKKLNYLSTKFYQLPTSKTVGFTLVELIVVIVILAILGTIAFISFQGYSRNSRDSVRIADINSAKKSLEIFITKTGFYPTPDNGINITYSGAIVWTEGTLGSTVTKNIQSMSKVITDPLTSNEYTYSITSNKKEYQIGAISEGGGLTQNQTINNTYATDLSKSRAVAYITGNYNEKFTTVNTGTTSWILAQPSIIVTDIGTPDLGNLLSNKKVVFNNYGNYPHSYNQNSSGGFNYTNGNPIIFTGTLDELHDSNPRKLEFVTNLKQAYISTDLATNPTYNDIINLDATTDSTGAINLVISYINSNKGGIKLEELALLPTSGTISGGGTSYSCATQPTYTHAIYTVGAPTQLNQARQNTNNTNPCYYTCSDGYTGSDCNIAPITGWRDLDSNCQINDIVVGTQTWAGCNSTLGTGIEYSVDQNCSNYVGGSTTGCNRASNTKEDDYNSTYGINNIWGKLYTWDSMDTDNDNDIDINDTNKVCGTGYHVPTDEQWTILENYLAGTTCRTGDGRKCNGLGWKINASYDPDRKLVETLKIPLAGCRLIDGVTFYARGSYANLWSSTPNSISAYIRLLNRNESYVGRYSDSQANGYSVRCLKD